MCITNDIACDKMKCIRVEKLKGGVHEFWFGEFGCDFPVEKLN
jgi:hypothetical protein